MQENLEIVLREAELEAEQTWEEHCDSLWNALNEEQQQAMFHSVIKRVYQYRIEEGRGYRGTLYDGFKFGPSAYRMGMSCGFFSLHNMLYDAMELEAMKGVTRFEVIDEEGRTYVKYLDKDEGILYSLQDDDRTLKVFIDYKRWKEDVC